MAFGPFSSESNATDNRIIATDQAQAVRRGTVGNPNSFTAGERSNLLLPGAIQLQHNASLQLGGISLDKLKHFRGDINFVTESTSDPQLTALVAALANQNDSPGYSSPPSPTDTGPTAGPAPTPDTPATLGTRITDAIHNGLSSLTGFFKTTDATGQTTWNKTALIFAAAIVGLILWRKFKR